MFPFEIEISLKTGIILIVFLKNWPNPASFSFIFGLFQTKIQFLQQINMKNVMSIQYPALGFESTTFGT